MGKHVQTPNKRYKNRTTGTLATLLAAGFILTTTSSGAMAATPNPSLERVSVASTAFTKTQNLPAAAITAPANVKISFATPAIASTPAPKKVTPPAPVAQAVPQAPVADVNAQAEQVPATANVAPQNSTQAPVANAGVQANNGVQAAAPVAQAPAAGGGNTANNSKGEAILASAMSQLGRSQDCTMLVTNSLKSVGINFHDWPAGYLSLGKVVSASEAQVGSLLYYRDGGMGLAHIAVFAGYDASGQAIAVHGGWNGNQTAIGPANLGSGPVFIQVS